MTLNRVARWLALGLAAGAAWLAFSAPAQAIPLFARQTGHNCAACHISYPELTAYGREFKLNGYTFGEAQPIPLAAAIMAEYDTLSNSRDATTGAYTCSGSGGSGTGPCERAQLVQYSIFFGGKLSENFGMFGQMSGSEFPVGAGGSGSSAGGGAFTPTADNTEFRYVHRFATGDSTEPDTVVGLNLNNNPTMQDVWNAVPAWRFPWFPYLGAGYGPLAAPYIDNPSGGHDKVGVGVYAWWHKTVYAEFSLYRSATGSLSWMNWGNGGTEAGMGADVLAHYNPYYRLAYSHDWGYHSVEVGVFGMTAHTYNCNPSTNTDPVGNICGTTGVSDTNRFRDTGVDAQYQFNKSEPWVFSASGSYIHESNDLTPLFVSSGGTAVTTADHTVNELQVRGTAYYDRKYGVTLGYSMLNGTQDQALYASGANGGSLSGNPASNWWTLELNYLPLQDLRFTLLYQGFTKINGGGGNFDGFSNNASGQNRLTGAIWFVF
ncbi:putative cytochrome c1 signal peptide protein [Burkholderiales bacterium]|nr:putative cytochrome c1 signal peptide protein [Burkholderiales bacterium]